MNISEFWLYIDYDEKAKRQHIHLYNRCILARTTKDLATLFGMYGHDESSIDDYKLVLIEFSGNVNFWHMARWLNTIGG